MLLSESPSAGETVVCAILAAGTAKRMGSSKNVLALGGFTFLERALSAAAAYRTIVVAHAGDASLAAVAERFDARIVRNDEPERGMTHSLRLASAALGEPRAMLAVLLVDTPLVDADVLGRVIAAAQHADVAYPVSGDGRPGHPVVFGSRARRAIADLPDGDTLRQLRDDPDLHRTTVLFSDERPFTDVDTVEDLERLRERYVAAVSARATNIASPKE